MKIKLLLIFLIIYCNSKAQQENLENSDCKRFKDGIFELINEETRLKFIITRNGKNQKEETFSLDNNQKVLEDMHFIVKWKNECEYTLLLDNEKSRPDARDQEIDAKGGMNNKITTINDYCYFVETTFENFFYQSKICTLNNYHKL